MQPAPPNIDADGDGVVSEEEILAAVRGHLNHQRDNNPQAYRRILRRFDADNNGEISDAEALEIHRDTERRMQQDAANDPGRPMPGAEPRDAGNPQPGERRLHDNGLLKGIKIEGLNLSSDL
ncbi:MAG: EF-hand domain-containing protein [Candidatus Riflebacteria bacterium]|nr:EF-hand domain-containing protein [Candidatus Riflebacteria bacterium]